MTRALHALWLTDLWGLVTRVLASPCVASIARAAWIIQLTAGTASFPSEQTLLQGRQQLPLMSRHDDRPDSGYGSYRSNRDVRESRGYRDDPPRSEQLLLGVAGVDGRGCLDGLTVET